jgi:hypothetical protein
MSSLISFNIYRTESFSSKGISYTVRFSKSNDSQEHCLFVTNDSNGKETKYQYSNDTANDFEIYNETDLESSVLEIIENDIGEKII